VGGHNRDSGDDALARGERVMSCIKHSNSSVDVSRSEEQTAKDRRRSRLLVMLLLTHVWDNLDRTAKRRPSSARQSADKGHATDSRP
jgi:hypothetical protein